MALQWIHLSQKIRHLCIKINYENRLHKVRTAFYTIRSFNNESVKAKFNKL